MPPPPQPSDYGVFYTASSIAGFLCTDLPAVNMHKKKKYIWNVASAAVSQQRKFFRTKLPVRHPTSVYPAKQSHRTIRRMFGSPRNSHCIRVFPLINPGEENFVEPLHGSLCVLLPLPLRYPCTTDS